VFRWSEPLVPSDTVSVAKGDSCVSFQFGAVLGIFEPGSHRLPGAIPDGVELWFCLTRRIEKTRFGGRVPTGGTVFGEFDFQIAEPHRFLTNVVGMGEASGVERYLATRVQKATSMEAVRGADGVADRAHPAIEKELAPLGVRFLGFASVTVNTA